MFTFALWDRNQQALFLARDRLGVKPMYYALLDDGTLLFGSELKSLLAFDDGRGSRLRRQIDPLALEEYFALGYVPEPRTIFRQAKKLTPPRPAARVGPADPHDPGQCSADLNPGFQSPLTQYGQDRTHHRRHRPGRRLPR